MHQGISTMDAIARVGANKEGLRQGDGEVRVDMGDGREEKGFEKRKSLRVRRNISDGLLSGREASSRFLVQVEAKDRSRTSR